MGQLSLTGTLQEQQATVQEGSFPSGMTTVPFTLNAGSNPKNAVVSTGVQRPIINSASSFVTLPGVGTGGTVTRGDTLYFRCLSGGFIARLTYAGSPDVVVTLPVDGVLIMEFDPTHYLKLLEVQGSGTIEWYVSGQQ